MSSTSVRIEALGKENYDTWCIQVEAVLVKNGTWEYVSGESQRPEEKPEDQASIANARKWDIGDRSAKSDLILNISPSELKQVKHCKTANAIWKKLKETYQSQGPARKVQLLEQLITTKFQEGEDMRQHLTTFTDVVDKLAEMDIVVIEELLSIIMLHSLPDSYETFCVAIKTRDDLPKPEALKIKLMEEHDSRKRKENSAQGAMFVKGQKKATGGKLKQKSKEKTPKEDDSKDRKFWFRCNRCNKRGHKASECLAPAPSHVKQNLAEPQGNVCENLNAQDEVAMLVETSLRNWCLDSGASSHMCGSRNKFSSISVANNDHLLLANQGKTKIDGKGTVKIATGNKIVRLENTLFVPELRSNLLSVSKITDHGFKIVFDSKSASVHTENGEVVMVAKRQGDLYFVNDRAFQVVEPSREVRSQTQIWHEKLGHVHEKALIDAVKGQKIHGITLDEETMATCEICIKGKQVRTPFPSKASSHSDELLGRVHSDICGPFRTESISGSKYFVTFIDDKSRWCEVHFLRSRSQVYDAFEKYKSKVETSTGKQIKIFRSDNGTEYRSKKFELLLEKAGIKREFSTEYSPQQNGVSERKNRTLLEMARCMLLQAKLPPKFWAEAVLTANHMRNRCPSRSISGQTPYFLWKGKEPNVDYFQIFGCNAYALETAPGKGKFEERSRKCIFIGYSLDAKAYRLWDAEKYQVIRSRDVKFTDDFEGTEDSTLVVNELTLPCTNQCDHQYVDPGNESEANADTEGEQETDEPPNEQPRKRAPGRPRIIRDGSRGRPVKQYHYQAPEQCEIEQLPGGEGMIDENLTNADNLDDPVANLAIGEDPRTIHEALHGPNASEWLEEMKAELRVLEENRTWEIVDRPRGKNIVSSKWVLKTKLNADGTVERRKARLVARGFTQRPGIDYTETFAPVARLASIRTIMALAVEHGLEVHQIDFVSAYLNGDLEEEVYMEPPDGIEQLRAENAIQNGKVYRMKKALYGLKQSGRQWYMKLDEELRRHGLNPSSGDPCVYMRNNGGEMTIVSIYVDDLILASNQPRRLQDLKKKLSQTYKMKDLGRINYCLGIEFKQQEDGSITLCQRKYVEDILRRFNMTNCKPVSTPMDGNAKMTANAAERPKSTEVYPYQSLIGSLMYLAVATRPDISYAVSALSQYNVNFGTEHWLAAKRVLRYLRGTTNLGLKYTKSSEQLTGFTDADWGSDVNDRKSYTGYVFKHSGAAISWESRKQRCVALSSTEAEYLAITEATKEAAYLRRFLWDLEGTQQIIPIWNDNQSAQKLISNPVFHSRTKHIGIRHHFVREMIDKKEIELRYLPTEDMTADILTKALFKPKHKQFCEQLGLTEIL